MRVFLIWRKSMYRKTYCQRGDRVGKSKGSLCGFNGSSQSVTASDIIESNQSLPVHATARGHCWAFKPKYTCTN